MSCSREWYGQDELNPRKTLGEEETIGGSFATLETTDTCTSELAA